MITQAQVEADLAGSERVEPEPAGSMDRFDATTFEIWRQKLRLASSQELLRQALLRCGPRAALVTSFQAEGLVLLDLVHRHLPDITPRVITLDTGRLPQETYDLMDRVTERYKVEVEVFLPDPKEVAALVRRGGPNLFHNSPADRRACCQARKIEPLGRALQGLDVWITGLRRGQSTNRATIEALELDAEHGGRLKLNPLAAWSWQQVWAYIERHDVPYHAFYDRGYTSIGCAPCTRAVRPGADPRSGRWWWEESTVAKECGLHLVLPTSTVAPSSKEARP